MRPASRLVALALALALGVAPATLAHAQPAGADPAEAADAAFKRGQTALEAGKLDEACGAFEESLRLDVGVGALLNLARCHRLQGKILQSWKEYGQAEELATKAGQKERAEAARALVAELGAVLPRVTLEAPEPVAGLAVTIDGRTLEAAELGRPVTIEVGPHEVAATAPGHDAWRTTADVRSQAEPLVVRVPRLTALPQPGPEATAPAESDLVPVGFVVGGVGVASLVVGSIFGVLTLSDASAARDDPDLCPDEHCTKAGRDVIDGAEVKGIVSTVGIGVGVAAIATGVILYVVGGDDGGAPAAPLAPVAGPGDAGLGASLAF